MLCSVPAKWGRVVHNPKRRKGIDEAMGWCYTLLAHAPLASAAPEWELFSQSSVPARHPREVPVRFLGFQLAYPYN
jgi:hypothetical protein